jgi:hypothetical protein
MEPQVYELLSEFYICLWGRIDNLTGAFRWARVSGYDNESAPEAEELLTALRALERREPLPVPLTLLETDLEATRLLEGLCADMTREGEGARVHPSQQLYEMLYRLELLLGLPKWSVPDFWRTDFLEALRILSNKKRPNLQNLFRPRHNGEELPLSQGVLKAHFWLFVRLLYLHEALAKDSPRALQRHVRIILKGLQEMFQELGLACGERAAMQALSQS